jgi:hypothetical protein
MQQPAIQAALNNLVEVIRTALTAEFLEYFRDGDARPARGKPGSKPNKGKKAPRGGVTKKTTTKTTKKAAKRPAK